MPEKRGGGNVAGTAQRGQREGEGNQQAEDGRLGEGGGIDGRLSGHWQDRRERARGKERNGRAEDEAGENARGSDQHDLDQVDENDEARGRADTFERSDDTALAVDEGAYGIGDADAADDQRGQADERQELRKTLDVVRQRRRGIVAGAHRPAGLGEFRLCAVGHRSRRRAAVEADTVGVFDDTAGPDQTGGFQRRHRDHQTGRKAESFRQGVGLVGDLSAQFEFGAPYRNAVADL